MFRSETITLDVTAASQDDLFRLIAEKLQGLGYVNSGYLEALTNREAIFPTGINTLVCGLAIPHTESDYIKKQGIAFVRLNETIRFKEMISNDPVDVKLLFFLLVKNKSEQVKFLSDLMGKFSDDTFLTALLVGKDESEILETLNERRVV
jgi:PTS system galactitol-specific IIA component